MNGTFSMKPFDGNIFVRIFQKITHCCCIVDDEERSHFRILGQGKFRPIFPDHVEIKVKAMLY